MYEATCTAVPSPSIRVGDKSGSMVRMLELYGMNTDFLRMKTCRIPWAASIQSNTAGIPTAWIKDQTLGLFNETDENKLFRQWTSPIPLPSTCPHPKRYSANHRARHPYGPSSNLVRSTALVGRSDYTLLPITHEPHQGHMCGPSIKWGVRPYIYKFNKKEYLNENLLEVETHFRRSEFVQPNG